MKDLSILIPTYNDCCTELVAALHRQATDMAIDFEIVVADDGSTDRQVLEENRAIGLLPHARLIERPQNVGRAVIRNFLVQQSRYEWLLFIDSDMVVRSPNFLCRYAKACQQADVIDGGVSISNVSTNNLRSLYEQAAEQHHTAQRRQLTPYQHLHTANLLVRRQVMLNHPFDERFRRYGYEDVFLGRQLFEHRISILHIDNPLSFERFETNEHFVSKTEEGLRTLHQFRAELRGYSRLLDCSERLPRWVLRLFHRCFGRMLRRQVTGRHPRLFLFQFYRLCYFISLY